MQNPRRQELLYQLRKCLLHLNRTYIAASACNEVTTMKEVRKCIDSVKRQIKELSQKKK